MIAKSRAALDRALAGGRGARADRRRRDRDDRRDRTATRSSSTRSRPPPNARPSPEEQYRYLFALGDFRDPALIDRGLQRSLTPQLRSQDTALYLAQFLRSTRARAAARWAFVTEHWAALEPKVTISGGDTNLIRSLARSATRGSRDEITAFFAAHPLPGRRAHAGADDRADQQLHRAAREADAGGRRLAGGTLTTRRSSPTDRAARPTAAVQ